MTNPFHVHDYEMTFPDQRCGHELDWLLTCRCGDTTQSTTVAVQRMQGSANLAATMRLSIVAAVVVFALGAWMALR